MSVSVRQKPFSRDFFDRKDPTESIGELIIPFSFSSVYDNVDSNKLLEICAELYEKVQARLRSGDLGRDIQFEVVDYKDAKQGNKENPRRYLKITRETLRKTRITILARFLPYGNKLYVSVDSFVLGNINWLKVVRNIALTLLVPFICYFLLSLLLGLILGIIQVINNGTAPFGSSNSDESVVGLGILFNLQYICCCVFPWLIFAIAFLWLDTIRNFRHEGNLVLGLRQSFNQILNTRSFNIDDVLMTLKSVLPLILGSIKEVFEKHNIPVNSLDNFATTIQNINNIQNVYGTGNAVAGAGGIARVTRSK